MNNIVNMNTGQRLNKIVLYRMNQARKLQEGLKYVLMIVLSNNSKSI